MFALYHSQDTSLTTDSDKAFRRLSKLCAVTRIAELFEAADLVRERRVRQQSPPRLLCVRDSYSHLMPDFAPLRRVAGKTAMIVLVFTVREPAFSAHAPYRELGADWCLSAAKFNQTRLRDIVAQAASLSQ